MKVSIQEIPGTQEEEILIRCHEMNDAVLELVRRLKNPVQQVAGIWQDEIYRLSLKDIFYFETVDNKSFLYGESRVFETKLKLYEFEEIASGSRFLRVSKSVVANMLKISHIRPSLSGRFEAVMENGERITVSRQYVPELKKQLGL